MKTKNPGSDIAQEEIRGLSTLLASAMGAAGDSNA